MDEQVYNQRMSELRAELDYITRQFDGARQAVVAEMDKLTESRRAEKHADLYAQTLRHKSEREQAQAEQDSVAQQTRPVARPPSLEEFREAQRARARAAGIDY